jgi:glutamate carboxypeptidase
MEFCFEELFVMDIESRVSGVQAYVEQRLLNYIDELRTLCAIDSYSYHKPGLDTMAAWLAARMKNLGMEVTIIENEKWGNDLLAVIKGNGNGTVLLLGHIDTVYPVGIAAGRPLRVEGDTIYGPGVCDMKGCILSAVYAIEAILAQGSRPFRELRFLCVSDEEIGERHCKETMQQVCQNCQGALVLEAARANGDIVSARKGSDWYTLTARGRSAHAGVEPEKGRNAIVEIAHQVLQFVSLNGWREGITVNAGAISGGTLPNVVPDFAQARFDLRFLSMMDKQATEARWRELMQQRRIPDVELTLESDPDFKMPMVRTTESLRLASKAQQIANMLGFSIDHVLTGGASDGTFPSNYNVPVLDGLGPIGGLDHSPQEYLMANSVAPRTALLAGLIATIGLNDL